MTRKHFQAVADGLKNARPENDSVAYNVWKHAVLTVMQEVKQFNSNFDQDRFLNACGYYTND